MLGFYIDKFDRKCYFHEISSCSPEVLLFCFKTCVAMKFLDDDDEDDDDT